MVGKAGFSCRTCQMYNLYLHAISYLCMSADLCGCFFFVFVFYRFVIFRVDFT